MYIFQYKTSQIRQKLKKTESNFLIYNIILIHFQYSCQHFASNKADMDIHSTSNFSTTINLHICYKNGWQAETKNENVGYVLMEYDLFPS